MADFKKYYPTLQANEGGYANNPKDPGGETWAGVARFYNPKWAGWKIVDKHKASISGFRAKDIPVLNRLLYANAQLADMVYQFYKINYWNSLQLDFVNCQELAEQMCDMGVNAGAMRPAKMVQWLCNMGYEGAFELILPKLVVDGDIGPKAIRAINTATPSILYSNFIKLRKAFYYYRVGQLGKVPDAKIQAFLRDELNVRSKPDQVVFLNSWLSRCVPAELPGNPPLGKLAPEFPV